MRHSSRLCSLGLFVLTLVTGTAPAEATYDACTTPCKCSKQLANATAFYAHKFETNVNNLVKMQRDLTRLLIAATAGNVATAQTALPPLAAAGKLLQECQEAVTSQIGAQKTGLPALANASAKLAVLARQENTKTTLKIAAHTTAGYFRTESFSGTPVVIDARDECGAEREDSQSIFDADQTDEKNEILEPTEYHTITVTCDSDNTNNCYSTVPKAGTGFVQYDLTTKTEEDTTKKTSRWGTSKGNKDVAVQGKVNITQGTQGGSTSCSENAQKRSGEQGVREENLKTTQQFSRRLCSKDRRSAVCLTSRTTNRIPQTHPTS
uniref:Variant surface glycoprotein 1702 n=1 Tax=Trypanosoma brucei TaxID=5691 RepID=M4TC82_9TRYP|nr:variant surface glycoprotein 1702 [Trypanosoma brucei]